MLRTIVAAFVLAASTVLAAQPDEQFRVQLVLECQDSGVQSEARSYVARELRALNDVRLVDNQPHFVLEILVLPIKNVGGTHTGYAWSVVSMGSYDNSVVLQLLYKDLVETVSLLTTNLYRYPWHSMYLVGANELQVAARQAAAQFDTEVLERARKARRDAEDLVKEMMKAGVPKKAR